jgi:hypothetical protein
VLGAGKWSTWCPGRFTPVKELPYAEPVWTFGEEKQSPSFAGVRTPDRPAPSLLAVLATLPRLYDSTDKRCLTTGISFEKIVVVRTS